MQSSQSVLHTECANYRLHCNYWWIILYSRKDADNILYSQLFWRALKLANWSKNGTGEYVCAARDPVAHFFPCDYMCREFACLAELILAI